MPPPPPPGCAHGEHARQRVGPPSSWCSAPFPGQGSARHQEGLGHGRDGCFLWPAVRGRVQGRAPERASPQRGQVQSVWEHWEHSDITGQWGGRGVPGQVATCGGPGVRTPSLLSRLGRAGLGSQVCWDGPLRAGRLPLGRQVPTVANTGEAVRPGRGALSLLLTGSASPCARGAGERVPTAPDRRAVLLSLPAHLSWLWVPVPTHEA